MPPHATASRAASCLLSHLDRAQSKIGYRNPHRVALAGAGDARQNCPRQVAPCPRQGLPSQGRHNRPEGCPPELHQGCPRQGCPRQGRPRPGVVLGSPAARVAAPTTLPRQVAPQVGFTNVAPKFLPMRRQIKVAQQPLPSEEAVGRFFEEAPLGCGWVPRYGDGATLHGWVAPWHHDTS